MAVLVFKVVPQRIKSCKDCRYHKDNKCILFISLNKNYEIVNARTETIRAREGLCAPDAKYFKPIVK